MKRLLVCGFGPFPGAPQNPAAAVVRRLQAGAWTAPGTGVAYAVLPTIWTEAPRRATETARACGAEAVLLIGVAASARACRIETLARNFAGMAIDAAGKAGPGGPIAAGGAPVLAVPFDAAALAAAASAAGAPVELSADAGDYLCNLTLYRLLAAGAPTAFLHVPMARECDPSAAFGLDEIEAAARATVAALAAQA
jgi:pyroglutamyl-peptidase